MDGVTVVTKKTAAL